MPSIPPLVVGGGEGPQSFTVEGVFFPSTGPGLGFRIATDGTRHFCVLFDCADGTPILLSDGEQSLLYDLANNRVVQLSSCPSFVRVGWTPDAIKPLSVDFGADMKSGKTKSGKHSWIKLDKMVSDLKNLRVVDDGATQTFGQSEDKMTTTVEISRDDASWFRFARVYEEDAAYQALIEVTHVGQPVPDEWLKFPDVEALKQDSPVVSLPPDSLLTVAKLIKSGMAIMPKAALAAGGGMKKQLDAPLLYPDWDALAKQDIELGKRYRDALAKQGFEFKPLATNPPATQPTTVPAK
jgi:hypothetical protein